MINKILYVQYTNPAAYPPLEHSSRILAQEGWEILFLGIGALGDANILCFPPHHRIQVRQMPFQAAGWRQKLHYIWFCLWVIVWTIRWQPNWIYASDILSCPPGLFLNILLRKKIVYHEHDSPAESARSLFMKICWWARSILACHAKICILPNQQRLEYFLRQNSGTKNGMCVWNCPAKDEITLRRLPHSGEIWLLYHGSIVPDRLPVSLLESLPVLPDKVRLRVVGYETVGSQGYSRIFQDTAKKLGIAERLEFPGSFPRRTALFEQCQKSDIGLALMPLQTKDINLQCMVGASNKAFDYLVYGLPLLVSDLPDWQEMFVKPGYGLACKPDEPASIAAALRWFVEHPDEMRAMGERGRERIIKEWNYETQFAKVKEKLETIV
jgi:glycosyltransferase involved in cell wall biosynthesis